MPKDTTSYSSAEWDLEYLPETAKRHESFAKMMDHQTNLEPHDHRELCKFANNIHNTITKEYFSKLRDGTQDDAIGKSLADLKVQFAQLAVNHHHQTHDTGRVTAWTHAMTGLTSMRPNLLNEADFNTVHELLNAAPEEQQSPDYQNRLPLAYQDLHHGALGAQESWQETIAGHRNQHTISSEDFLATYRDLSIIPKTGPNTVQIVGTGGQGIWERDWSRRIDPERDSSYHYLQYASGHQVPGLMRAMCFAKDIASLQNLEASARDQATKDASIEQAAEFTRRHPDDAEQLNAILDGPIHIAVEAGTDLIMQGLLENNLTKLNAGRNISETALASYNEATKDPDAEHRLIQAANSTNDHISTNNLKPDYHSLVQAAYRQAEALLNIAGTKDPNTETALVRHAAVQHNAQNCSAMEHSTHQIVDSIFPEPQTALAEIHLRQLMQLTQYVFRDQRADFIHESAEHLQNGDIQAAADALQHTHQYQLNLIAVFYNQADKQGNPDHAANNLAQDYATETLDQLNQLGTTDAVHNALDAIAAAYPIQPPERATGPESQCREMLYYLTQANLEVCTHLLYQAGVEDALQNSAFINHVTDATAIVALAHSGELEDALARAANNANWPN